MSKTKAERAGDIYETARENPYVQRLIEDEELRRKLEPDPAHPRYLITEPGMGYRFVRE